MFILSACADKEIASIELGVDSISTIKGVDISIPVKGYDDKGNEVEGEFLSTELNEAIIDIDYPTEEVWRDGTVVVGYECHMKDVPAGQVIHVTITKELQERLSLDSNVIEINCRN